ncbi:MAG: 30S ribosomal protein S6e [Thermoplasmata archaeon]|nr:30S ribosomal protein S6e [Thermoplasmata archaeon]RLF62452.1 MAG: 30S ribosomal protein S6e [Thermoplasmata archaeon]
MVEFKVVVNNPKDGKSYNIEVTGHHANSLIGKKIGDEVDGIFVSLPGYKLQITGGTDKDGFPMRSDLPGMVRKRLLLTKGVGFKPKEKGLRRRKTVHGNTVSQNIVQINMKITKHGPRAIEDLLALQKKEEKPSEEKKEATEATEEKLEEKPEKKEEVKEEKKVEGS